MIRNLVMALFMVPVIAMADTNNNISKVPGQYRSKIVVCNLQDEIIKVMEEYGEHPWIHVDGGSFIQNKVFLPGRYVISINPKTQTWSLLEFYTSQAGEKMACMLGFGKGPVTMNDLNKMKGIDL